MLIFLLLNVNLYSVTQEELKKRTKQFAVDIIRFEKKLPQGPDKWYSGDQLYRCGTAVGANYRAACRSKTKPTFIHKMGIVEEEADESCYWLEILAEENLGDAQERGRLLKEASELTAIFTAANKSMNDRTVYKK